MKNILLLALSIMLLAACNRVTPAAAPAPAQEDKVIEKTTIINPPAVKEEKKVENNTTIVNPPAEDKKQKDDH